MSKTEVEKIYFSSKSFKSNEYIFIKYSLYSSSSSIQSVASDIVYIENGKGKWKFKVSNEDWGRYLLVAKDEGFTCIEPNL